MKKFTVILLIIVTVLSSTALLSGCIFNNGSEDEVAGIYGIHEYFYKDIDSVTHNYADDYEYYLLVLNDDKTGKVILKPVDGEESSYDITYGLTFGTGDDAKKVASVQIKSFMLTTYTKSNGNVIPATAATNTSFEFYPMREDLIYRNKTLMKNSEGSIVTVTAKLYFTKLYNKTTDSKIKKAKVKQKDSIDSRKNTSGDSSD